MAQPASQCTGNLPAKTELEAWVVSNGKEDSVRLRYYQMLHVHLRVDVSQCSHKLPPWAVMTEWLSQYKFSRTGF